MNITVHGIIGKGQVKLGFGQPPHSTVFPGATAAVVYEEDIAELLANVTPSCEGGSPEGAPDENDVVGGSPEDGRSIDPQVDVCGETHLGEKDDNYKVTCDRTVVATYSDLR